MSEKLNWPVSVLFPSPGEVMMKCHKNATLESTLIPWALLDYLIGKWQGRHIVYSTRLGVCSVLPSKTSGICYGLNCIAKCIPKFVCWSPKCQYLSMVLFGERRVWKRWLKWNEVIRMGLNPVKAFWKENRSQMRTEERWCEITGRRQRSTSLGKRPQQSPVLLASWW